MKRIIWIVALCFIMTGCSYYKSTLVRLKGDEVKTELADMPLGVTGTGIKATIIRQVFLSADPSKAIPELKDIEIDERTDTSSSGLKIGG